MKRFSTSVAAAALIAGAFALPAQAQETEIVVHYAMPGVFGEIQEEIAARFMEEESGCARHLPLPLRQLRGRCAARSAANP